VAGKPKLPAMEAFARNMDDASHLVGLAEGLTNQRARRMRRELRARIGDALKLPQRYHDELDCVESPDLFVVLKPGGRLTRDNFACHDPLLRQAIVAGCAALETYLADQAISRARLLINRKEDLPPRLAKVAMSVGDWRELKERYQRERRGITELVVGPRLRELATTNPYKVGELLSTVGVPDGLKLIDRARSVPAGTTTRDLNRITERRNKIAHEGDRRPRGAEKAPISATEVRHELEVLCAVAEAVEEIFTAPL